MTEKKILDVELLKQADSKYSPRDVVLPLEIDGVIHDVTLGVDKRFRPSKVMACIDEFISKLTHVKRFNRDYLEDVYEPFLLFMLIKHFTTFPAPEKYTEQAKIVTMLLDNGLLYRIFAEFDESEIEKFREALEEASKLYEENINELVSIAEDSGLKNKLEEMFGED